MCILTPPAAAKRLKSEAGATLRDEPMIGTPLNLHCTPSCLIKRYSSSFYSSPWPAQPAYPPLLSLQMQPGLRMCSLLTGMTSVRGVCRT